MRRGGSTGCRTRTDPLQIGVISDTHGLLRPEAVAALAGAAHILHAGDIGGPAIVEALEQIAPVTAIRGNVDRGDWARAYPDEIVVEFCGLRILMVHDRKDLKEPLQLAADAAVSGHSHRPVVERAGGVLYLNPGSAGPRRFRLPVTVALMQVGADGIDAEIVELRV